MNKKGFTLIEVLLSISIFSVVAIMSINFIKLNDEIFYSTCNSIERESNLRIAMEFIYRTIRDCNSIEINGSEVIVDNKKIYVKNDILRYNVDSQQIAPYITCFYVNKIADKLYKIYLSSGNKELLTFIKVRNN